MALTNYSDLKTSIANYLGRSDLTSQIPDFITLAEIRLNREVRIRQMLQTYTATMTGGNSTVSIPSDFLEMRDIYIDSTPRTVVSYMAPSSFSKNARTTDSGKPVFYTANGSSFEFAPIPDTNYTLKVLYYAKPTALSDSNPTNVFMANCPDALLYGALGEAEPYLMNDARIPVWAQFYQNAIDRLNDADQESEFAGVPLSMSVASR